MTTCNTIKGRKVHAFFFKNEIPALNKVLHDVNSDDKLPNFSRATLHRLLKVMGFKYITRNREAGLVERDDIILWRKKYLHLIKTFREEGRRIYYLDETWVNAGHTVKTVWHDKEVKSRRQAFLSGLSTGLKNPSGKGKRLIVLHIGSESGFVENGLLLFESKSTKDYHEEMDGKRFEEWFSRILPLLGWLHSNNITDCDDSFLKIELWDLIPHNLRAKCDTYVVDELAKQFGKTVLRLPPYHCALNPI